VYDTYFIFDDYTRSLYVWSNLSQLGILHFAKKRVNITTTIRRTWLNKNVVKRCSEDIGQFALAVTTATRLRCDRRTTSVRPFRHTLTTIVVFFLNYGLVTHTTATQLRHNSDTTAARPSKVARRSYRCCVAIASQL